MLEMPRYYFSIEAPIGLIEAKDGEELPDDLAAHHVAQLVAQELAGGLSDGCLLAATREGGEGVTEVPITGKRLYQ